MEEKKSKFVMKNKKQQKITREEMAELRKKLMEERDEYELTHCGGFTRIYPELAKGESKYDQYIEAAQRVWDRFTGSRQFSEAVRKKSSTVERQFKVQKKDVSMCRSKYPVPVNRKPLYYVKASASLKQKEFIAMNVSIAEALQDEVLRKRVIGKLAGEHQDKNAELDKIADSIIEKLAEYHKNPLEAIEQHFMHTKTQGLAERGNLKRRFLGPGNYVVPKTMEFSYVTTEFTTIQKKGGEGFRRKKC
eukprot:TRINITY_DN8367_c0_g4_i2.p1 TRINITY_DN8367_c0_g4~~TRINITY_DN8367_c0_g4_i2.p1  ORF type:complete len:248 (-),score=59.28 TRINITY_DN8367_c0_g4_i2:38-781(-)